MKSQTLLSRIAIVVLAALIVPSALAAQDASTQTDESATTTPAKPVPLINQPLIPDAIKPGSAGFTLTINGTGFVPGSVVKWNGSIRATTFLSRERLIATIFTSDIAKPHSASVTVVNPGPGGGISNVVFFEVTSRTSSISLGASEFGAGSGPLSVAVGDFNGDGKLDLAVANNDGGNVSVLLGNGDGTFQAAVNYGAGSGLYSVAVGDFNRDGKLDLATVNAGSNNVSVLLGNGDGTFRPAVNYGAGSVPVSLAVGDLNGDGKLDVAVANNGSDNVSVLLGNGDGTFRAAVDYSVGITPLSVAVGDFNGDGKLDLVVGNSGNSGDQVSVLLGNGDGTFQAAVNYGVGSGPISMAVGDFNGDGKLDLAVANYASNNLSVLLGNGDGTFRAAVDYSVGSYPQSVAAGDFNGDGELDLAVANFVSNSVSVLLGNGNGTFQPAVEYSQTANESVAVGDFNGDGRLDMVVAGSPMVVLLQGTVSLSKESLKFPDQVVGTRSAAQVVTLTNIGPMGLSVSSIRVTGTNATDFSQTDTCSDLPAGTSCAISVTFKPTEIGPRSALVTITDDSPGSPQSVALSGTGVILGVNATLSPTSLAFATRLVGTTSPAQSMTLSNYGTATLKITRVIATADFSESNTCGSSLAAGTNCTINVIFKPTQRGRQKGTLSVTDNATGSPQTVSLSGIGTVVKLSPTSLFFYCCPCGPYHSCACSPSQATTLTNTGSTALAITKISISGAFSQTNTCDMSLGAGQSCTITVLWSRLTSSDAVTVIDNGGDSPQTVSLRGIAACKQPGAAAIPTLDLDAVSEEQP